MSAVLPPLGRTAATSDPAFADTEILEREDAPQRRPLAERLGLMERTKDGASRLRLPPWLPDLRTAIRFAIAHRILLVKAWGIVGAVLTVPLLVWFWNLGGSDGGVQQTILGQVRVPESPGLGRILAGHWWGWLLYAIALPVSMVMAPALLLALPLLAVALVLWLVFGPIAFVVAAVCGPFLLVLYAPRKLIATVTELVTLGDQAKADVQRFNAMLGVDGVRLGATGEPRLMDQAEFEAHRDSDRQGEPLTVGTFGGEPFEVRTPKHVTIVAPTRMGKGQKVLVPNLMSYPGSVLCTDPKGENALLTAKAREKYGPSYVLDPMGITGLPTARYNPLANIHADELIPAAQTLAAALIIGQEGDHWTSAAETLLAGVIAYVATVPLAPADAPEAPPDAATTEAAKEDSAPPAAQPEPEPQPAPKKRGRPRKDSKNVAAAPAAATPPATATIDPAKRAEKVAARQNRRNAAKKESDQPKAPPPPKVTARDLPTVRRLIMRELPGTLHHMAEDESLPAMCRDVGAWGLACSEDEWSGIVSTVIEQTKWMAAPQMIEVLSDGGEQVDLWRFRTVVQSVYVCLPAPDFAAYSRWLRLIVARSLDVLTKQLNPDMPYPVRFILDELAQLGTLGKVESALTLSAGYGVQLWGVWQHLKDIERCYPRSGLGGWVSCSGARIVFGAMDNATCNYFAELSGVLKPHQLRLLPPEDMLLMVDGCNPSIVKQGKAFFSLKDAGMEGGAAT